MVTLEEQGCCKSGIVLQVGHVWPKLGQKGQHDAPTKRKMDFHGSSSMNLIDSASQMDVRVSTDQKILVIGFPISPILSYSNFTLKNLVKHLPMFNNWGKDAISYILQKHTKTAARIKSVVVLKEHSTTMQFYYTQHIPLFQKVCCTFATTSSGNKFFYGCRFSMCADGAFMMRAKLVTDVGDNYCPKERLLDRPVLESYNMPPVGPTRMLVSILEIGNLQNEKRTCCNYDDNISVASRDNLVFARNQFAADTKFAPQVLQQYQAPLHLQVLDDQVQTLFQWQVAHQQVIQQQQTMQQHQEL
eukprot:12868132-Ditylum_brightwellii.AAC.1